MKDKGSLSHLEKEDRILISHLIDLYNKYLKTNKSVASDFLNPYEISLASSYLNYYEIEFSVYEEYPFLEKKIIYFGDYDNFITFYKISISSGLTHPKLLGNLFKIGLTEHTIGDIFIEDNLAYYVNLTRLNPCLEEGLTVINGEVVRLEKIDKIVLEEEHFKTFNISVASMRLDLIVGRIASQSRSQATNKIMDKEVLVNYREVKSSNQVLRENDILSIRRVGKFRIGEVKHLTKKDKLMLEIIQYI